MDNCLHKYNEKKNVSEVIVLLSKKLKYQMQIGGNFING